jgi:hypothetical protein
MAKKNVVVSTVDVVAGVTAVGMDAMASVGTDRLAKVFASAYNTAAEAQEAFAALWALRDTATSQPALVQKMLDLIEKIEAKSAGAWRKASSRVIKVCYGETGTFLVASLERKKRASPGANTGGTKASAPKNVSAAPSVKAAAPTRLGAKWDNFMAECSPSQMSTLEEYLDAVIAGEDVSLIIRRKK